MGEIERRINILSALYCQSSKRERLFSINLFHPISNNGELKMGTKSTLIECLEEKDFDYQHTETWSRCTCDWYGASAILMLTLLNTGTFEEYGRSVIIPYIENQLRSTQRLDIVFDRYFSRSLKNSTRKKRGVDFRRRVVSWQSFLRNEDNKRALSLFLSRWNGAENTTRQ